MASLTELVKISFTITLYGHVPCRRPLLAFGHVKGRRYSFKQAGFRLCPCLKEFGKLSYLES
jgi:hypothetical protein